MSKKLKPCPFCGGDNLYVSDTDCQLDNSIGVYVRCVSCGASLEVEAFHPDPQVRARAAMEDVTGKWNARAELEGVLEALESIYPYALEVYENCGGDKEQRGRAPRMRDEIKNAEGILKRLYWRG